MHNPRGHQYGAVRGTTAEGEFEFTSPYGVGDALSRYAMPYSRYLAKYGASREQMATFVVTNRLNASRNPDAVFHEKPITVEDYLASRMIVEPFSILDCDMPVDGAGAVVLTTEANSASARFRPAHLSGHATLGVARGIASNTILEDHEEGAARLAAALWSSTPARPADVASANLYDGFSYFTYLYLDALGFCARGEAPEFIQDGRIAVDGSLPLNTSGGVARHGPRPWTAAGHRIGPPVAGTVRCPAGEGSGRHRGRDRAAELLGRLPLAHSGAHVTVAIVTGSSRGIGAAIATHLAAQGMSVACTATSIERAAVTADDIARRHGVDTLPVEMMVEDAASVGAAIDAIREKLGPIGVLVNNAGVTNVAPLVDADLDQLSHVIDVNVKGVLYCAQAAARAMIEDGTRGVIINIGSVGGFNGFPARGAYGASKAAVVHLTKVLAIELAQHGIRVNCVAPGFVETDMVKDLAARGILDVGALRRRTPLGELIPAEDIAQTVGFLTSAAARHITGESLLVDGGWTAYGHL